MWVGSFVAFANAALLAVIAASAPAVDRRVAPLSGRSTVDLDPGRRAMDA
jgi:hypothetical protein